MAAALAWMAAPGCSVFGGSGEGAYEALADEDGSEDLAPLKRKYLDAKRTGQLYRTSITGKPRVSVETVGERGPEAPRTFVLIHGAFADSRCWRFLGGDLLRGGSVTTIDLPGCGRSDKPDPDDGADYSPHALATATLEALETHLTGDLAAKRVTLVGHSLGGTVALEMMTDATLRERFARVLSRVDSLVLMAPVDRATELPLAAMSPKVREAVETPGTIIDMAHLVGVLREQVSEGSIGAVHDPRNALREEADERVEMLRDTAVRSAMRAMLIAALPPRRGADGEAPDWAWIERERARQKGVTVPTLIIWGERDESVPPSMGFHLAAVMPKARLVLVERTMHSPYLEKPGEVGETIRRFVANPDAPNVTPPAHPGDSGEAGTLGA